MIDYQTIKELAKTNGQSVNDLIVLAPANDPFYVGSKGEIEKGEWFAGYWRDFGYSDNVHLRRVHYQLVSQETPVIMPNGLPYENTDNCWAFLCNAGKYARYLGLVDVDAFVDKRNPDAHEHAPTYDAPPSFRLNRWQYTDIYTPDFPDLPRFEYEKGQARQGYHVELWVEKTTMDDVLLPICERYQVNLVTGAGELSITAVRSFLRRARRQDKPCVILYIADFDPAGYRMSVSVARKIEYFNQELGYNITLQPIVLTQEQVNEYKLPPMPFKKDANARRAANLGAFSDYAVELDALEALHPGELADIVSREIERYIDPNLDNEQREIYRKMQDVVETARQQALEPFMGEWEALQETLDAAVVEFDQMVEPIRKRLPNLINEIKTALANIGLNNSDFLAPEPRAAEPYSLPLFDSKRNYLEQLDAYRAYDAGQLNEQE